MRILVAVPRKERYGYEEENDKYDERRADGYCTKSSDGAVTIALTRRRDLDSRNEGCPFVALHLFINDSGHDGVSRWRLRKCFPVSKVMLLFNKAWK